MSASQGFSRFRRLANIDAFLKNGISQEVANSQFTEFCIQHGVLDVCVPMLWVPPGSFMMGSPEDEEGRHQDEGPQHLVTFKEGFWMGKYTVTEQEWAEVMGGEQTQSRLPKTSVNWHECMDFCKALTEKEQKAGKLPMGLVFTLPSEAQWEYAARAGTTGPRYGELDEIAWTCENSGNQVHEVGLKKPNAWGFDDMLGNVWEWCLDDYHPNYEGAPTDGSAWIDS